MKVVGDADGIHEQALSARRARPVHRQGEEGLGRNVQHRDYFVVWQALRLLAATAAWTPKMFSIELVVLTTIRASAARGLRAQPRTLGPEVATVGAPARTADAQRQLELRPWRGIAVMVVTASRVHAGHRKAGPSTQSGGVARARTRWLSIRVLRVPYVRHFTILPHSMA